MSEGTRDPDRLVPHQPLRISPLRSLTSAAVRELLQPGDRHLDAPRTEDALVGVDRDHGLSGAVRAGVGVCFVAERFAAVTPRWPTAVGRFDDPEPPRL